jgi:hypothetical protein
MQSRNRTCINYSAPEAILDRKLQSSWAVHQEIAACSLEKNKRTPPDTDKTPTIISYAAYLCVKRRQVCQVECTLWRKLNQTERKRDAVVAAVLVCKMKLCKERTNTADVALARFLFEICTKDCVGNLQHVLQLLSFVLSKSTF